ncbi:MAG TPA: sigma-70 family RNA polymerase sigma factor [Streptosporangiaceae bacterium]
MTDSRMAGSAGTPVLSGPRARFEHLYAATCGPLLGYALRRTANSDDAADVVAETFLTAWRRLDDVPAGDQARLWLYGVARNVLANYRRGERRRYELSDRLRCDLAAGYRDPEYTGDLARLRRAFTGLAEADRELLALVAWEGLDHSELAVVLGCSRNAVRIRLHRARSRFAAALADQDDPAVPLARLANGDHA